MTTPQPILTAAMICGTTLGPAPHVRWLRRNVPSDYGYLIHERVLQVGRVVMDGSGAIVWEDVPEVLE